MNHTAEIASSLQTKPTQTIKLRRIVTQRNPLQFFEVPPLSHQFQWWLRHPRPSSRMDLWPINEGQTPVAADECPVAAWWRCCSWEMLLAGLHAVLRASADVALLQVLCCHAAGCAQKQWDRDGERQPHQL